MISESTHWYDQNGDPAYTIIGKNGKERNVTLRDARELNLVPSVTTIIGVAAKPSLENWKIDQALMSALTLPRLKDEPLDTFMKRAKLDSKQQAIDSANRGTEIHAAIEIGFTEGLENNYFLTVRKILDKLFPGKTWTAEDSFAHPLGFGGKIDLYSDGVVVDFKTKDNLKGKDPQKLVYDEHGMQLSAYALGLGMENPERVSIFIDRHEDVAVCYRWDDSHQKHLDMFLSLLKYWQLSKNYKPGVKQACTATAAELRWF